MTSHKDYCCADIWVPSDFLVTWCLRHCEMAF